jgi:putative SOS response-associated peptidase YedK
VWPRPPLLRCERTQAGILDPAASAHPKIFAPSWNAAPTDALPVVRYDRKAGQRSMDLLHWGLVPHWSNDINVGFAKINAKAGALLSHGAKGASLNHLVGEVEHARGNGEAKRLRS